MEIKNEKLKVLFYRTDFYGAAVDGGVSVMHKGMMSGMKKLGHSCVYVSSGRMVLPEYIPYYYIPFNKFFRNLPEVLTLPYINKSVRKLENILEIEKSDFLFQHHHDFNFGGSLIKRDLGIPFVLHCDFIQLWVKKNWGKLYLEKLLKWGEEIQWENADSIMVVSKLSKELMVNEFGVDEKKIFVNPNAVDTDIFHPEISGKAIRKELNLEDKFICTFTGTFGPYHGLDVMASSIKFLKDRIPNVFFLFVGDGDYRPIIENIMKIENVPDKSLITGTIPYSSVPMYLAASDILISPCVGNDGGLDFFNSPIKLFEYLGMGKPIVASEVGQQGEVIKHEHNGLLVPEKSPEALAEAIVRLYKDPELAQRLGRQARIDAVEKHDWKVNAETIVKAYNFAISKK